MPQANSLSRRVEPLSFSLGCLEVCNQSGDSMLSNPSVTKRSSLTTNSLNRRKKIRVRKDGVRRSWGASDREDGNQSFWACIQEPYDYIMSTHLMPDSFRMESSSVACESGGELELTWDCEDVRAPIWSLDEFFDQYTELYQWLIDMQVSLYSVSNPPDKEKRKTHEDQLNSGAFRRRLFCAQGEHVERRFSRAREDVRWRVNFLNNKWEHLEAAIIPRKVAKGQDEPEIDLAHEESVLQQWLEVVESQLQPLTCRLPPGCKLRALKRRFKFNQNLLKDIEAHGPILKTVIRQHERRSTTASIYPESTDSLGTNHKPSLLDLHDSGIRIPLAQSTPRQSTRAPSPVPLLSSTPLARSTASPARKKTRKERDSFEDVGLKESEDSQEESDRSRRRKKRSCVPRRVRALERRWHQVYLGALEWRYYLEDVIALFKESPESSSDSENEPVSKCRRVNHKSADRRRLRPKTWSDFENDTSEAGSYIEDDYVSVTNTRMPTLSRSPSCELVSDAFSMAIGDVVDGTSTPLKTQANEMTSSTSSMMSLIGNDNDVRSCDDISNNNNSRRASSTLTPVSRPTPNCATFDCKHADTDEDKGCDNDIEGRRTLVARRLIINDSEDSSVDENELQAIIDNAVPKQDWLRSNEPSEDDFDEKELEEQNDVIDNCQSLTNPDSSLRQLICDAEKLICEPLKPPTSLPLRRQTERRRGVKRWLLNLQRSRGGNEMDSCDASGELTTGESEISVTSDDDLDVTASQMASSPADSTPTAEQAHVSVLMRPKKSLRADPANRLSQLSQASDPSTVFSPIRASSDETTKQSSLWPSDSLLSSTDACIIAPNMTSTPSECGALRRKRTVSKTRRRNQTIWSRQSDECSANRLKLSGRRKCDAATRSFSSDSDASSESDKTGVEATLSQGRIVKSSSFSGYYGMSASGGGGSPISKRGAPSTTPPLEDVSSLSEQAWDPYQEGTKYLSEAYSEDMDREGARRLLDSFDDYRNFMDSDEGAFLPPAGSSNRRRRRVPKPDWSDSDVDSASGWTANHLADLASVVAEAKAQLGEAEAAVSDDNGIAIDLGELISKAQTYVGDLQDILRRLRPDRLHRKPEFKQLPDLIERWESLKTRSAERQRQWTQLRQMQRQVKALRLGMEGVAERCAAFGHPHALQDPNLITDKVMGAKALLEEMESLRNDVSALSAALQRLTEADGVAPFATLKEEGAELQRFWEQTQQRVSEELCRLQSGEAAWQLWQEHKQQLDVALNQDSLALKVMDAALSSGAVTEFVRASATHAAQMLNERKAIADVSDTLVANSGHQLFTPLGKLRLLPLSDRLEDSGTSGYESCSSDSDLSERERRLAFLRKLATHIQAALPPGSQAWSDINQTLCDAERSLLALQERCGSLFKRAERPSITSKVAVTNKRRLVSRDTKSVGRSERRSTRLVPTRSSSPRRDVSVTRREWLSRVAKVAVPLQLGLLVLACVLAWMQPSCCDSFNTFHFSMTPQLRFVHGSTPI